MLPYISLRRSTVHPPVGGSRHPQGRQHVRMQRANSISDPIFLSSRRVHVSWIRPANPQSANFWPTLAFRRLELDVLNNKEEQESYPAILSRRPSCKVPGVFQSFAATQMFTRFNSNSGLLVSNPPCLRNSLCEVKKLQLQLSRERDPPTRSQVKFG